MSEVRLVKKLTNILMRWDLSRVGINGESLLMREVIVNDGKLHEAKI